MAVPSSGPARESRRPGPRRVLLLLFWLCLSYSVAQFVLHSVDRLFMGGVCAGLGVKQLPPEARAHRLMDWVSAYDEPGLSSPFLARFPFLTPPATVRYRSGFRDNCGAKAWLLCELARHAGLQARELRLCDDRRITRHVVCEIWVDDRWAVFDPLSNLEFRRSDGQLATAAELRDPRLLAVNAARSPGYDARRWRFDHAERLRFEKLPLLGGSLRRLAESLTGRPSEELAVPVSLTQPRLLLTGASAALAVLLLAIAQRIAAGHPRRPRSRRVTPGPI